MRTIEFRVTGEDKVHCSGCELRISTVLGRMPGVRDVQARARTQRVVVKTTSNRLGPERLRAKLEELGYQVEVRR